MVTDFLPEWISRVDPEDYRYLLPPERIAQYPLPERDKSKLLIYNNGKISDSVFSKIHEYLPAGSIMVLNNSRVIKARLYFENETGAKIEVFCLEPLSPSDYAQSMMAVGSADWKCIIGNSRKWRKGKIKHTFVYNNTISNIYAEKLESDEGETWRIRFTWGPETITFGEVIGQTGHIPLPPYIERVDEPADSSRYQTVYSKVEGSVAAPTAGLHFTESVLQKIALNGIGIQNITLHVGAGTFKPVKTRNIQEHEMHHEYFFADKDLIGKLACNKSKVISVGTTSLRALESIYWAGVKIKLNPDTDPSCVYINQWEPYLSKHNLEPRESLEALLEWMSRHKMGKLFSSTRLMIVPGYSFKIPEILITNFHLPCTTLLMLVAAWTGEHWKKVYSHALENNYRFLSYGDSSILFR